MNRLNPPKPSGKFAVSSDSLFALLLLIALFQIAMSFSAIPGLVKPAGQPNSAVQNPAFETNAPIAREGSTASSGKSSGFQSYTTHG